MEFLFNTCCVQSGVSELCVWQPSLEEVSLDYSNHPNVRMNECRGGVYSAAAHFSSTWHKAPALALSLAFSLSFFFTSPRSVQTEEPWETTHTVPLTNAQFPLVRYNKNSHHSLKLGVPNVYETVIQIMKNVQMILGQLSFKNIQKPHKEPVLCCSVLRMLGKVLSKH